MRGTEGAKEELDIGPQNTMKRGRGKVLEKLHEIMNPKSSMVCTEN